MDMYRKARLACAEGMSQRQAAQHVNISRDSVSKILAFSEPPGDLRTAPVKRPKLDGFTEIIDVFARVRRGPRTGGGSRLTVDWRVSTSMTTQFVLDALDQALWQRKPLGSKSLIHHSDRGCQGGINRSSQHPIAGGADDDGTTEVGALNAAQIVFARTTSSLAA